MSGSPPRRILLVQFADIGDLILTTPAIAALREARPQDHLTLLTSSHAAPVLAPGLADECIPLEKGTLNASRAFFQPRNLRRLQKLRSAGPYDAIVYFHRFSTRLGILKFLFLAMISGARRRYGLQNGRAFFLSDTLNDDGFGAKQQAQYWLDLVALLGANPTPRPAQVSIGTSPLAPSPTKRIVIHPGSGSHSAARRWSAQRFARVAQNLRAEFGAEVVLIGQRDDAHPSLREALASADHDLIGHTSLPQLAAILRESDLLLSADSGVMHLAAAVGTPQVAIFGPSNHHAWSPWSPNGPREPMILRSGVACSPCSYVGMGIGLREGCPARTCMRLVSVEQVLRAAHSLLNGADPTPIIAPLNSANSPTPADTPWSRQHILGLPIDGITYEQWLEEITAWVAQRRNLQQVCTINPEFVVIARHDANFRNILHRSALNVADGVGMLWAAQRRGCPLPTRITGADGLPQIAERAAERGWRLFFLGAAPGIAEKAAAKLCARHPKLHIVGCHSGGPEAKLEDEIVARINESGADLLFVAFGAPTQEKWIARNSTRLQVAMAMGVGGALDYLAGVVPRAPLWVRRLGLEWLFRLMRQPWRWRRMLRLPQFVLAVLLDEITNRPRAGQ